MLLEYLCAQTLLRTRKSLFEDKAQPSSLQLIKRCIPNNDYIRSHLDLPNRMCHLIFHETVQSHEVKSSYMDTETYTWPGIYNQKRKVKGNAMVKQPAEKLSLCFSGVQIVFAILHLLDYAAMNYLSNEQLNLKL